jgi:hypothetical protein
MTKLTVKLLKGLLKENNVKNYSKLKKNELINLCNEFNISLNIEVSENTTPKKRKTKKSQKNQEENKEQEEKMRKLMKEKIERSKELSRLYNIPIYLYKIPNTCGYFIVIKENEIIDITQNINSFNNKIIKKDYKDLTENNKKDVLQYLINNKNRYIKRFYYTKMIVDEDEEENLFGEKPMIEVDVEKERKDDNTFKLIKLVLENC